MKKILLKFKLKVVNWLFKETLIELNKSFHRDLTKRDDRICELENHARMMKAITNVGVNLEYPNYGHSWVAVSIRGEKQQWVQFFDGSDDTISQLQKTFSGLQRERIIVDGGPYMRPKDFWF